MRACLLACVLLLCACQTLGERGVKTVCAEDIGFDVERIERSFRLVVANDCHVPIAVGLDFPELVNLEPSVPLPVQIVVPANSTRELVSLSQVDPYEPSSYVPSTSVHFGARTPVPPPAYEYPFPFGGSEPRRLVQGVGGTLSHQGDSQYAFDFEMPIGTPILAAREGLVLDTADGFPEGKLEPKYRPLSNHVLVLHDDGTVAVYTHLSIGVRVERGQRVEVGTLLGLSGNSGYSAGPHLHFDVRVQDPPSVMRSIPIRFTGDIVPEQGEFYGPMPR